ncbi:MAG: M23 family peptidase [Epsilonproteobacteria bacterium]|nr:MAG: M23 family peptidase [Campylobacterota bacterium]
MVRIGLLIFWPIFLYAAIFQDLKWKEGESYLIFLDRVGLPQELYYEIDKEDQKLTEEIRTGVTFQILRDANESIKQVLIPVNDELQLHLYRDIKHNYQVEAIPIISDMRRESLIIEIENSPYQDILKATGSKRIAQVFVNSFKNSLNFRRDLRKGDPLVMIYDQKYRLGKPFSMPKLLVAMIEMRGKRHFVYLNKDERYYDEKGAQVEGFLLARPVRNARVSSVFTKRRFHPVLKRYRAHLGIDYAARRGTPIMAAGSGKIIFAGRTRGYGNLIKIRHSDGYMTLYAHQKSFKRGIKRGKYVKQGQVIGYVGTTGLSTGPHLHFGLYKHGRAINPARVVRVTTKKLTGKARKSFLKVKKELDLLVEECLVDKNTPVKYEQFDPIYYIDSLKSENREHETL